MYNSYNEEGFCYTLNLLLVIFGIGRNHRHNIVDIWEYSWKTEKRYYYVLIGFVTIFPNLFLINTIPRHHKFRLYPGM